jgi:hypothetical protein
VEPIFGHVQISGSGPRLCAVEVIDAEGNTIGTTISNSAGTWRLAAVAMPPGTHQVRAIMRNSAGAEFTSDTIAVHVGDPVDEPIIEAETIDAETVAAMAELDAEERAANQRVEAAKQYLDAVNLQARGYDHGNIMGVLMLLGRHHDQFCADVARERLKLNYSRLVCLKAAGEKLERADERFIWESAGKSDAEFTSDVEVTQHASRRSIESATNQ